MKAVVVFVMPLFSAVNNCCAYQYILSASLLLFISNHITGGSRISV